MRSPRKIQKLLNWLAALGVLIEYSLHTRYGQTVMIYDRRGVPRIMNLGTALAAARAIERNYWWGE